MFHMFLWTCRGHESVLQWYIFSVGHSGSDLLVADKWAAFFVLKKLVFLAMVETSIKTGNTDCVIHSSEIELQVYLFLPNQLTSLHSRCFCLCGAPVMYIQMKCCFLLLFPLICFYGDMIEALLTAWQCNGILVNSARCICGCQMEKLGWSSISSRQTERWIYCTIVFWCIFVTEKMEVYFHPQTL